MTRGLIIHSTRSGRFTLSQEYQKTIAYMKAPGNPSSHRVIGFEVGQNASLVPAPLEAWHAQEDNLCWLGYELTQPKATDPYSDWQYECAAWQAKRDAALFGFPLDRQHIVGHEETAQGKRNVKSDPGPLWDWDKFMHLLTLP